MRLACWFRRRAETRSLSNVIQSTESNAEEKFAIARRARQHAKRMRYLENARKSSATSGYFAANADFDVDYAGPFSARSEEPAPL